MKEKITKIDLELPEPPQTEQILKELFPEYRIKYKKFPDIWEIRNKQFRHSVWYYPDKQSMLKTTLSKEYRELVILNIILFLLIGSFIILNEKYKWLENSSIIFLVWFILFSFSNFGIWKLKPKYKHEFINEHDSVLEKIKKISTLR